MSELTGKFAYTRTVFMSVHDAALNATVEDTPRGSKVTHYRAHGNVNGNKRSLGRTMKLIAKHRNGECGCAPARENRCKAVKDLKETYGSWAIDCC